MKEIIFSKLKTNWSVFLPLLYFCFCLSYIFLVTGQELIKDEGFFMRGAREFGSLSFETYFDHLKSYYPPQAPLIHTISGLIFYEGISIKVYRVMNAFFSFLTLYFFFDLLKRRFSKESTWTLIFCTFMILMNPYFFLISSHYYADGLYILLTTLCFRFYFLESEKKLFLSSMLTPLSRQFGLFIPLGSFIEQILVRKKGWIVKALINILCLVPIFSLFYYWEAFQPSAGFAAKALLVKQEHGPIIISYAVYYLSALGIYLLPMNLYGVGTFYKDKFFIVGTVIGLALFVIFPPIQNFYLGLPLGLFHKIALKLGVLGTILMGCSCAFYAGRCAIYIKSRSVPLIIKLWIVLMFGIATFSPVCWDKYILDLILLNIIGFLFWKAKFNTLKEAL